MDDKVKELVEWVAGEIAESHGYVYPCGDGETDDSMRYWARRTLSHPGIALMVDDASLKGVIPLRHVIPLADALKEEL